MEEQTNSPLSNKSEIEDNRTPEIDQKIDSPEDMSNTRPQPLPPLPEIPAAKRMKKAVKSRVKAILAKTNPIPKEELPADISRTSDFFDGTELDLPPGWIIEQRPRTNVKYHGKKDEFYYEPEKFMQFRSLKSVWKYIEKRAEFVATLYGTNSESSSNHLQDESPPNPNNEEEEEENKRKREMSLEFEKPPATVTWCLKEADQDLWVPEVDNPEKLSDLWTHKFNLINSNSNEVSSAGASWKQTNGRTGC